MSDSTRAVRLWLWSGAALTLLMVVIGGITRLTGSGLSITRWEVVTGTLPPLSAAAWDEAFALYRETPQYHQINAGMSLEAFKFIYFWEWFHRFIGRIIGLVFLIPFVYFLRKGRFTPFTRRRAYLLLALGAGQGLMGWIMVMSGLVDQPYVSHFRLAAHLSLAFTIMAVCADTAIRLSPLPSAFAPVTPAVTSVRRLLNFFGLLLGIQIVWGAFTAGLHAGLYFPTFPAMNGSWVPPGLFEQAPIWQNFVMNPRTIHWFHRLLGYTIGLTGLAAGFYVLRNRARIPGFSLHMALFLGVLVQIGFGGLTVVNLVPLGWASVHQVMAAVLVLLWVSAMRALPSGQSGAPAS